MMLKEKQVLVSHQPEYRDFADFAEKTVVWGRKSGNILRSVLVC